MKITLELPDSLARRFKATIPNGQRSRVVAELLTERLQLAEASLERAAKRANTFKQLTAEMKDWQALMKPKIERGDVWWINLDPTRGAEIHKRRPCVVISANAINQWRATPIVIPLGTSADGAPPVVVPVPSAGKDSVAVVDQVRAVHRSRFVDRTGALSLKDLHELEEALKRILELP